MYKIHPPCKRSARGADGAVGRLQRRSAHVAQTTHNSIFERTTYTSAARSPTHYDEPRVGVGVNTMRGMGGDGGGGSGSGGEGGGGLGEGGDGLSGKGGSGGGGDGGGGLGSDGGGGGLVPPDMTPLHTRRPETEWHQFCRHCTAWKPDSTGPPPPNPCTLTCKCQQSRWIQCSANEARQGEAERLHGQTCAHTLPYSQADSGIVLSALTKLQQSPSLRQPVS